MCCGEKLGPVRPHRRRTGPGASPEYNLGEFLHNFSIIGVTVERLGSDLTGKERIHPSCQRLLIAFDDQSTAAFHRALGRPESSHQNGKPQHSRFENDNGLSLVVARHDEAITSRHNRIRILHSSSELHRSRNAEAHGQLFEFRCQRTIADDHQFGFRLILEHLGESANETRMILLRRQPANSDKGPSASLTDELCDQLLSERLRQ